MFIILIFLISVASKCTSFSYIATCTRGHWEGLYFYN